jgi:hypothetical protein
VKERGVAIRSASWSGAAGKQTPLQQLQASVKACAALPTARQRASCRASAERHYNSVELALAITKCDALKTHAQRTACIARARSGISRPGPQDL